MKTFKLYTILLSALALASCNKNMTKGLEDVDVNVTLGVNMIVFLLRRYRNYELRNPSFVILMSLVPSEYIPCVHFPPYIV